MKVSLVHKQYVSSTPSLTAMVAVRICSTLSATAAGSGTRAMLLATPPRELCGQKAIPNERSAQCLHRCQAVVIKPIQQLKSGE